MRTFGKTSVVVILPVVASVARRGAHVVVSFRDVSGGLTMRGQSPSGFELCGDTPASCRWPDARVQGRSVLLSKAAGATPCTTRGPARRCLP